MRKRSLCSRCKKPITVSHIARLGYMAMHVNAKDGEKCIGYTAPSDKPQIGNIQIRIADSERAVKNVLARMAGKKQKSPTELNEIVDKVLSYKPKPKSMAAKKRKRRAARHA